MVEKNFVVKNETGLHARPRAHAKKRTGVGPFFLYYGGKQRGIQDM